MKFKDIQVGDEIQVIVTKLFGYKASLESDDIEGFIHKNEVSWRRIKDISDVIQLGEKITARVIKKIEKENVELLEFTLKKEKENPILKNQEKYRVGNIIEVKVKHIIDYGIEVETEGVSGLILVSEISWDTNIHPSKFCKVEDIIKAKIIDVDIHKGTLSLSMKDLLENPWDKINNKYKIGDLTEVVVKDLCRSTGMGSVLLDIPSDEIFGKAILDGEVEVFLTIPNFSDNKKKELRKKRVKAKIIYLNIEKQFMKLSFIELS